MKVCIYSLLINLITVSTLFGVNDSTILSKKHTVQFNAGHLAYANTVNLPNGLPGLFLSIEYSQKRSRTSSNLSRHFAASIGNAALRYNGANNKAVSILRFNDVAIELGWHKKIPQLTPNTEFTIGFGPTFISEITYPTKSGGEISNTIAPFGKWGVNCTAYLQALVTSPKYDFGLDFNFSVFGAGHLPKPPYVNLNLSQNPYTYYLRPNAAYHLLNYNMLNTKFSISTQRNNLTYTISYLLKYFNHSLAPFNQMYAQQTIGVGVTF